MNEKPLTGQIAWITGSGRGIGRSTAFALADKGAKVVFCSRTESEIFAAQKELQQEDMQSMAIRCDVTNAEQINKLVSEVSSRWGSIDILINNAGIFIANKVVDMLEQEWDQMLEINLKSAFLCSRAVLPGMIKKKSGQIINIVSVAGKNPYPDCSGYCASKYGLYGFTDVLRMETRQFGIKVTACLPGATDTDIWGEADIDRSRMMTTAHVAQGIAAICCNSADIMTEEVVFRPLGGDL